MLDIYKLWCFNSLPIFVALPPFAMVQLSTFSPMRTLKALSTGLASIALLMSVGIADQAYAAGGTLFIDQTSPVGEFGHWIVSMPADATFRSSLKTKLLNDLTAGDYSVSITNPAGSFTKMTLVRSGTVIQEVLGNTIDFEVVDDSSYRLNIEFTYTGNVEVRSDPANVFFTMESLADGSTFTGVTPMIFADMPPVTYKVRYDIEPSCEVQKDIQRELIYGSRLIFWSDFTCGEQRIPLAGRTAERIGTDTPRTPYVAPNAHVDMPAKRIVQTSSMSEVVAGGHIRYTVSISNMTRGTLHNIDVVDRYNPEMVDIVQPLTDGGVIAGNEIVWNVPELFAGQSWTTTFTARAKDHLVAGDRIVFMAHAYSDEADFDLSPEAWSSVAGVGIAYMPQTGGKYDVLFALAALIGAALITNLTISRKQSV